MSRETGSNDCTGSKISRRRFVTSSLVGGLGMALTPGLLQGQSKAQQSGLDEPSDVVVVHDSCASFGGIIDPEVARIMVDEGIKAYTGESEVGDAWMSVLPGISPEQVIGIKVNAASHSLPSHPVLVYALADSLTQMTFGSDRFPANNIIIWDRTNYELQAGGFAYNIGTEGVRCFGTNSYGVGFSSNTYYANGIAQRFSLILDGIVDHNINVGVLKNHGQAGVTLCMKNHYGSADNISIYPMHYSYCNPYIPALNQVIRDDLGGKDRLMILDAIFGAHYGGPGGGPTFVQNEILISEDIVAVDRLGKDILNAQGCSTLYMANHVATAANAPWSLGNYDLESINIIEVEEPSSNAVRERPTGVIPEAAMLGANYPNPFNPRTTIPFRLARPAAVQLEVFDAGGRRVKVLLHDQLAAGEYEVVWDGRNQAGQAVSSGRYFCRLTGPELLLTQAMTLLK